MYFYELLTRPGCGLCDQARPLILEEVSRVGGSIAEVDIDSDDGLTRDYGLRIPVLRAPGGEIVIEGVIEARPLRKALRRYRGKRS